MLRALKALLVAPALALAALATGPALSPLATGAARAEAPLQATQVPGYYRVMVGTTEVTALFDGLIELDKSLLKNAKPDDVRRLLARMFVGDPKMQTAVNAYLVNTGKNLVLIDAGAAKLFGPSLGNVIENMKAAGYAPAQVDTVLITHLHADHVGGLNDAAGKPWFPAAKLYVAEAEAAFWLSAETAAKAPEPMRPFFKMAKDSVAPYESAGRMATFKPGAELVPGITAIAAAGHTPGHTGFRIRSGEASMLVWGDIVHAHAVQFAQPQVVIEFDTDPKQAAATRLALFGETAKSRELVAGMHLPFPGIGRVRDDGKGTFAWVPLEYAPLRAK